MSVKITSKQLDKALIRFVQTFNIIEFEEFLKGAGVEITGRARDWGHIVKFGEEKPIGGEGNE